MPVGDELEVGIGTHGQFSTAVAIRVAKELEEFSPFWFEEPVPPENIDEMARVAAHTSIPIASGERLVTKFEFAELLKKQAAQIIQLDVGQCGGILESKKIAGMGRSLLRHDRTPYVLRSGLPPLLPFSLIPVRQISSFKNTMATACTRIFSKSPFALKMDTLHHRPGRGWASSWMKL